MELVMPGPFPTDDDGQMDAPTSRAVADGIGEKLRQSLGTEQQCPDQLRGLLDQLRDREADETPNTGKLR